MQYEAQTITTANNSISMEPTTSMDIDLQEDVRDMKKGKYCPQCSRKGHLVDTQIVKAMLTVSLEAIRPTRYYFCASEGCVVVYFAEDGAHYFVEEELRERVYQKHPHEEETPICYCFHHTLGSIRRQWRESGESSVVATITVGTQSGQCACDIRNPQASCCLGNVRAFVQQMMKAQS